MYRCAMIHNGAPLQTSPKGHCPFGIPLLEKSRKYVFFYCILSYTFFANMHAESVPD